MSSRRWGVGVAVAVAVVLAVGAAGVMLFEPRSGPVVEHRYPAGGFTLALPSPWRVHARESGDAPWEFIEADRPTRLGPSDAWLWLNRTDPGGRDPLATARGYSLASIRQAWGDVEVATERTTFAGHPALRLRFSHPYIEQLGFLPAGDVDELRLITEFAGQVYELGVAGWRGLPREARDLERLFRLSPPRGVRTIDDTKIGVHIAIPAAWNRGQTPRADMPDAVLTATAPSDPPTAWVILWKFDERVETAISQSASKAAREGKIVGRSRTRIGGVPATRIDFLQTTTSAGPAHQTTWIFDGPDGKTWQLLVGSTTADLATAAEIAASVAFLDQLDQLRWCGPPRSNSRPAARDAPDGGHCAGGARARCRPARSPRPRSVRA